jgi:regulator of replication initiation timing
MTSLLEENKALKAEVERLREAINNYLAWRNPALKDSGPAREALTALRRAARSRNNE